jgi:eukaryotic-like serine/threonine-protein kinase
MTRNGSAPEPDFGPRYDPIALISRGNDYEVWDAWSFARGSRVIVKTPIDDFVADVRKVSRLIDEGLLLIALTHPHIVRGYEISDDGPRPMIVMETLSGQSLSHMLEFDGVLGDEEAAQLGLHLGSAVRYLHANGRLHLDLKPSNVIAEDGRAKLIDLGLAAPPGPIPRGTGTWSYLAPEQALGTAGPEADVWGLGATLYETLRGWPPFDDPNREIDGLMDEDIEFPQLERPARPLAEVSSAGPRLAALIDSCLQPEPSSRPTLPALMEGLERVAALPAAERRWSRD